MAAIRSTAMAGVFVISFSLYAVGLLSAEEQPQQAVTYDNADCHGVFYGSLGCFTRQYPFNNTPELPQEPDFLNTRFRLYTSHRPHDPQTLSIVDLEVMGGTGIDVHLPVKVLIHGFLQTDHSPWVLEMIQALLEHEDLNIITINWSAGAGFPYSQAAANTRIVGVQLARLISLLSERRGVSVGNFHLIGHSLGAHVAGHAGRTLRGALRRITGLDPADPNFSYQPPEVRLDPSDARWVDVIHTDGGPYTEYGGYGTLQAMGHIDFYPNGGRDQPGCYTDTSVFGFMRDAYRQGMINAEYSMTCSHDRSISLFLESISSFCAFISYPCDSMENFQNGSCMGCGNRPCPSMGYRGDLFKVYGTFYLNTSSHTPFCGYHYLVQVMLAEDMPSAHGELHVQISGNRQRSTQPLLLYSGELTAGQVVRAVLLSTENVGHITSTSLTFQQSYSYFFWLSSSSIKVDEVMVEGITRRNLMYFCPRRTTLQSGQPQELTSGTRDPEACSKH